MLSSLFQYLYTLFALVCGAVVICMFGAWMMHVDDIEGEDGGGGGGHEDEPVQPDPGGDAVEWDWDAFDRDRAGWQARDRELAHA